MTIGLPVVNLISQKEVENLHNATFHLRLINYKKKNKTAASQWAETFWLAPVFNLNHRTTIITAVRLVGTRACLYRCVRMWNVRRI